MSIKVGDLRVGNKIHYLKPENLEITTLDWQDLKWCTERNDDFNKFHFGIPLTDKDVKQYGHFNLIKVDDEYFVCFGNYKTQVKFYHEVQNYYYLVNHKES